MPSPKRRRAPRGAQKSEVINFRIRPSTKALLKRAAHDHGRTVSAECEYQLQRALVEMGTGPTHALLAVVGSAVDTLIRRKKAPPNLWARDPLQFDFVVEAITSALRLFRPQGPEGQRADRSTEFGSIAAGAGCAFRIARGDRGSGSICPARSAIPRAAAPESNEAGLRGIDRPTCP